MPWDSDALPAGVGARVVVHGTVGSTMDEAARDPGERPVIHIAERQLAGRGRHGRSWESLPGNLHATIAWPDPEHDLPPSTLAAIQLAWAEAIAAEGVPDPRCKWPNDGYLAGKKWAGAIGVGTIGPMGPELLVGLGANLVAAPHEPVLEATALATHWPAWPGSAEATRLLLETAMTVLGEGSAGVFERLSRWSERDLVRPGEWLRIELAESPREGRYAGLTPEGLLCLDTGDRVITFASGEAFRIQPLPPR